MAISEGKVVGWFQGRMEWVRAHGQSLIVCDPRRADMKAILNAKIKLGIVPPFAPPFGQRRGGVVRGRRRGPLMMQVSDTRRQVSAIPAVTHVDGSGRLQTVYRQTNPRYYRLIECFPRSQAC